MTDERSSSSILRKTISEPQTGIEPATFWWPVRHSNDWASETQMTSSGAGSTYVFLSSSHDVLIVMFNSSGSNLTKTISESQTGIELSIIYISWLLLRQHICRTCTLAHHLSLGSSMVRASHRSSEGCGFDPHLELRNCFSEVKAWRMFIYHLIEKTCLVDF